MEAVARHAVKVAILPVVTFLGPLAAHLLTGSMEVESVFNLPGAGMIFVNSIQNRDVFLLGGAVIVYCALLLPVVLRETSEGTFLPPLAMGGADGARHWLGTDVNGQDLLYRLVSGARVSLTLLALNFFGDGLRHAFDPKGGD